MKGEVRMSTNASLNSVVRPGGNVTRQNIVTSYRALAFWHTMVGKKIVMAVTGVVLIGFVIAHMLGNLKIFSGPDEINAYSRFLREVGAPELAYGNCSGW
jgi:succinate dehydrogenase / fumarate reductase, cytochrome b subunit